MTTDLSSALGEQSTAETTQAEPVEPQEVQTEAQTEPAEPVEAPEPETKATPEPAAPEMVPVGVVQELRRELRELKQAAQQAQAPRHQTPDFIDPEGAQYLQAQLEAMQANTAAEISEVKARAVYGDDTVEEAFRAAEAAGVLDNFKGIRDPWGSLTKWHQQQRVMQEVGDDPAAYKARLEAEIRAKVESEMAAKQAAAIAGTPAPSLANVTGTGGGTRTTWAGPTPLGNILRE